MGKGLFLSLTKEVRRTYQPKRKQIEEWVVASLLTQYQSISVNITIVSKHKSQALNLTYRHKDKPTNVISLAYPALNDTLTEDSGGTNKHKSLSNNSCNLVLIGDIILCDAVIVAEAELQGKALLSHYAHMVVHGMLHLQGMDHQRDADAIKMEAAEKTILAHFGFSHDI